MPGSAEHLSLSCPHLKTRVFPGKDHNSSRKKTMFDMKSILRKRRPRFLGLSIILATVVLVSGCAGSHHRKDRTLDNAQFQTDTPCRALPIHATFLDEISWDIPHQNWGVHEWDRDFHAMKDMGIGTVVMIRSGLGPWLAAPFESVMSARGSTRRRLT